MSVESERQPAGLHPKRARNEEQARAAIGRALLSLLTLGAVDDAASEPAPSVRGERTGSD